MTSTATEYGAARLARWLRTALSATAAAVLAATLGLVLLSVILRYLFQSGLIGTEELGMWLNVALIALGAPLAMSGPLAMRLDLPLGPKAEAAARVIADAISLIAAFVLVFGSARVIALIGGTSPTLGLPEWVPFAMTATGGALIAAILALGRIGERRIASLVASAILAALATLACLRITFETTLPPSAVIAICAGIGLLAAAPLAHAFLAAAMAAMPFGGNLAAETMVTTAVSGMSRFLLLAIPFFLLTGAALSASGAAKHLVTFAASLVGHRRGGLAQTVLATGTLFSGASGSSVANAVFSATTFHPELVRHGYREARAGAIIAASSVLDNVIPPSIAFLILATATDLSVGKLLVGGLLAGLLMAASLAIAIHMTSREQGGGPRATGSQRRGAFLAALPAFGLGIIVVFGIRIGIVTTTEAAALAAAYTLALAVFARNRNTSLFSVFRQTAAEAAAIGLLIGSAGPFAFQLAVDGVAGMLTAAAGAFGSSPAAILAFAVLVLLLAGLLLDIGAAILLFGPLLLPLATTAGIDPIAFGVIIVTTLMIGGLTPPVGMLVLVVGGVADIPAGALFRAVLPYLAALLAAVALICAYTLLI
ncbi:TRAP transporter large permease subunit [Martelella radicis]|uniref:Tripartite ATP-independent transporter DctM subunit n=1 Tax=Martelella radicis TaxID=1397476 RepID=A0A7W6KH56_9HYPH|nr:TRAP transporter large permease subunit [Martelella radicis]MBB4120975.1 tripartite ATP-independent transporter DctM subunit [Martelella radicis]